MTTKETGRPAFPSLNAVMTGIDSDGGERWDTEPSGGMTLRQYAAIKLKVPDSGIGWLDLMIKTSLRDDFAGRVIAGLVLNPIPHAEEFVKPSSHGGVFADYLAHTAYLMADAMLLEAHKS